MTQIADLHPNEEISLISFASKVLADASPQCAAATRKAISSFRRHALHSEPLFSDITRESLSLWIENLLWSGFSPQTVRYYLDNLAAIHRKGVSAGVASPVADFTPLRAAVQRLESNPAFPVPDNTFPLLVRFARGEALLPRGLRLYADMLLAAVLLGGCSPERLLTLKADAFDGESAPPPLRAIAGRHRSPRRARLFPRMSIADADRRLRAILLHLGFPMPDSLSLRDYTSLLWNCAAASIGFSTGLLSSAAPSPEAVRAVALSLTADPGRWRVLRLRDNNALKEIRRIVTPENPEAGSDAAPELYSPPLPPGSDPLLRRLLFVRINDSRLSRFLRSVGEYAWCYRNTRRGDYAAIPSSQMEIFRATLLRLADKAQVGIYNESELLVGQRVRIIDGDMKGYEAVIEQICKTENQNGVQSVNKCKTAVRSSKAPSAVEKKDSSPLCIFRLRLTADNGIEWRLRLPRPSLLPIEGI